GAACPRTGHDGAFDPASPSIISNAVLRAQLRETGLPVPQSICYLAAQAAKGPEARFSRHFSGLGRPHPGEIRAGLVRERAVPGWARRGNRWFSIQSSAGSRTIWRSTLGPQTPSFTLRARE